MSFCYSLVLKGASMIMSYLFSLKLAFFSGWDGRGFNMILKKLYKELFGGFWAGV